MKSRPQAQAFRVLGGLLLVLLAMMPDLASAQASSKPELQLDTTQITGSRELPTVLNILPWKRPAAGELRGQPADSLMNQVLQPVNRVEFRRELRYEQGSADTPR